MTLLGLAVAALGVVLGLGVVAGPHDPAWTWLYAWAKPTYWDGNRAFYAAFALIFILSGYGFLRLAWLWRGRP